MVCFQSYVPQNLVKRDRFWGFFCFSFRNELPNIKKRITIISHNL